LTTALFEVAAEILSQLLTVDLGDEPHRVLVRRISRMGLPEGTVSKLHRRRRQRPRKRNAVRNGGLAQESELDSFRFGVCVGRAHSALSLPQQRPDPRHPADAGLQMAGQSPMSMTR
jgi:hypothetical protein